jgi:hypothetical protein
MSQSLPNRLIAGSVVKRPLPLSVRFCHGPGPVPPVPQKSHCLPLYFNRPTLPTCPVLATPVMFVCLFVCLFVLGAVYLFEGLGVGFETQGF